MRSRRVGVAGAPTSRPIASSTSSWVASRACSANPGAYPAASSVTSAMRASTADFPAPG